MYTTIENEIKKKTRELWLGTLVTETCIGSFRCNSSLSRLLIYMYIYVRVLNFN